jgi:putative transcriptional regulator
MGIVVNRRTQVDLATALPDVEELRGVKDNLFLGGPVGRNRVVLLLRSRVRPEASLRVVDDVFITTSADVLRRVISDDRAGASFHVYAGYAGWAPGQLDNEVARGDWRLVRGDVRILFDTPPSEIWPRMMEKLAGEWADRGGSGTFVQRLRTDGDLELVEHVGSEQSQPRQRADHDLEPRKILVSEL